MFPLCVGIKSEFSEILRIHRGPDSNGLSSIYWYLRNQLMKNINSFVINQGRCNFVVGVDYEINENLAMGNFNGSAGIVAQSGSFGCH